MIKKKVEERKPVELEIAELQRKFRMLENDKRAYSEDSQSVIRKQRATIEKLTQENHKMKTELNESRSCSGSVAEAKMSAEKLQRLIEQKEQLILKHDGKVETLKQLVQQIETTNRRISTIREERSRQGGVSASTESSKVKKQIRTLENRLDQGLQKFNEAIAANKSLRDHIDTLRRERVVFDTIYRKHQQELQQRKDEMVTVIEQANAAYEARDTAQAQMAALQQQADREQAEFEKEWRELGRLIDNDKKMKEYMRQKVRIRDGETGRFGEQPSAQEEKHRKAIAKNAWHAAKAGVSISVNQEKVSSYEEAFQKIQAATGISNIDDLVNNFIRAEEQNFSLFKYNNELSAEIEKHHQQIAENREELDVLEGRSERREDKVKGKLLATLEDKWNDIDKKAAHYDEKYHQTQETLAQIRLRIESIFKRTGCKWEDLPGGAGYGISEANMMNGLAVIEQRTTELVKLFEQSRDQEVDFIGERPKRVSAPSLQIKLPSTVDAHSDDEDDDDEDDPRPYTREELKSKTMRGINKKQKKVKPKVLQCDR